MLALTNKNGNRPQRGAKSARKVATPMILRSLLCLLCLFVACFSFVGQSLLGQNTPPNPANLGNDANGNPLRKAFKSGHISNYDESKVAPYSLPDPLVLSNGKPVRNADTWTKQRRPELIKLYETEIYGRVPANAPK